MLPESEWPENEANVNVEARSMSERISGMTKRGEEKCLVML